ncbi:hypothetical protein C4D60_Mb01t16750 [Musa balbisiana]|uniref:F-box domain-containing protein n=1 Tax=Musa balbisiana TaxID=52838 RepID=A0A4S8JP35_MUSBA|nr:hypothetical protein C4D60_Mb01t16750 [Musa balbisiana]
MTRDWLHGEVLKAVFPLLDGKDLASCMLVCRQWRDIARDEYLWKCICAKRWPSICKRPPPAISYYKLFVTFSRSQFNQSLPPARLSFDDLEFYIDVWLEQTLVFSEAVSGAALTTGIKNPPAGIPDTLKAHVDGADYKMIIQVEPRFTLSLGQRISVSVLLARKDTNEMACIINQSVFEYVDANAFQALAYDYLRFSAGHPFISGVRAWVSLLFMANSYNNVVDVFGIKIDFCDAANSENEVLWLLDMLDWK